MVSRDACYYGYLKNKLKNDVIYGVKMSVILGLFIAACVAAAFIGMGLGQVIMFVWEHLGDILLGGGNLILWAIVIVYVALTLLAEFYKGAVGDCLFCWGVGACIAFFAWFIPTMMRTGLPVPQLIILLSWGLVLLVMRYFWYAHTWAVIYCDEQERKEQEQRARAGEANV